MRISGNIRNFLIGICSIGLIVGSTSIAQADDPVPTLSDDPQSTTNFAYGTFDDLVFNKDSSILVGRSRYENVIGTMSLNEDGDIIDEHTYSPVGYDTIDGMALSPDGKFIVAILRNFDPMGNGPTSTFLTSIPLNPDGSFGVPKVFNIGSSYIDDIFFGPKSSFFYIKYDLDSLPYYSNLNVYSLSPSGEIEFTSSTWLGIYPSRNAESFTNNGKFLAIPEYSSGNDTIIKTYSVGSDGSLSNPHQVVFTTYNGVDHVYFSPDRKHLLGIGKFYTWSSQVEIFQFDENTGALSLSSQTVVDGYPCGSTEMAPDGSKLFVMPCSSGINIFQLDENWNLDPTREAKSIFSAGNQGDTAISRNGKLFAISFYSGDVYIYKVNGVQPEDDVLFGDSDGDSDEANGEVEINIDSSISLTLTDDAVDLSDIPGVTATGDDGNMTYSVKTNSMTGYSVNLLADQANLLPSNTQANKDYISVSLLNVTSDLTVDASLSNTNEMLVSSQNTKSAENGDNYSSTFSADIPWVNADDYTGTVTYTATVN